MTLVKVYRPVMKYVKASAFVLEPLDERGIIDLDGEVRYFCELAM